MAPIKKWQEPLFAIGGFGTSFVYTIQSAWLYDRYNSGVTIVLPILWMVLITLAEVVDGLIDVPIANWSDKLQAKSHNRYILIAIAIVPCILSFIGMWIPIAGNVDNSMINVIWVFFCDVIFFISYTLLAVPYLSALSDMVDSTQQRVRVASWQSFFNTIGYCLAYALFPVIFTLVAKTNSLGMPYMNSIMWVSLACTPLVLLMLIPYFLIFRRRAKMEIVSINLNDAEKAKHISIWSSLKIVFKEKAFRDYIIVLLCYFMGLQIFLGGMGHLNKAVMGLSGWQITVMNTAAFAPIPLMLLLYNWVNRKWGIKTAMRSSFAAFALAMCGFTLAWTHFTNSATISFIIGLGASTVGSYSIGAFFSLPYIMPSQIASDEAKRSGTNHAGMYFAAQGLVTQIAGAVADSAIVPLLLHPSGYSTYYQGATELVDYSGAVLYGPAAIVLMIFAFIFAGRLRDYRIVSEPPKGPDATQKPAAQ
jgi:GPH family glycoside/pentoside/hexuronide:cation symporter